MRLLYATAICTGLRVGGLSDRPRSAGGATNRGGRSAVEATSRLAFSDFEARLRDQGFGEDQEYGVICRWRERDAEPIPRLTRPAQEDVVWA